MNDLSLVVSDTNRAHGFQGIENLILSLPEAGLWLGFCRSIQQAGISVADHTRNGKMN
jgi:hypothetical protein